MTPLLSDARLARQASDGDAGAFTAIYKRYHQGIYRFCLSILGRPEDAQEALQNTMVKALRSLPGEKREIQLKPWLYRVAHNESIDLLRKRREGPELDAAQASGATEIAETVALRQRLGRLLADLGELPERQRSALVMRELAGLGYEQIGEAFESSASVARQTVYEARLGLRELEAGREMSCDQVTRQLSEADGRVTRRRDIQAHLRDCAECRAFRDSIDSRRHDLAAISPLPAAFGASILSGLAGGQAATSVGGGAAMAGAGATAGKVAATSVALKAVATVAVVATVGVTAADRGGLIDAGLPGGKGDTGLSQQQGQGTEPAGVGPSSSAAGDSSQEAGGGHAKGSNGGGSASPTADAGQGGAKRESNRPDSAAGAPQAPASPPEAARHGQETAAAHKASGGEDPHRAQGQDGKAHGHASKPGNAGRSSSGSRHGSRAHHEPSAQGKNGSAGKNAQPAKTPPPPTPEPEAQPAPPGEVATEPDGAKKSKPEAAS